ncbi:hypothetical protein Mmc1_3330 [Magnetococcus marinus MC-1]|uniref:DUF721 domain-containing protein n=2 Tax=Magnetococcus TaxID=162171 RepID=A0LCX3_MAGMM|nr:hypothetical protein Mmc1_3330 [Magnetococcus marinus MC-1]
MGKVVAPWMEHPTGQASLIWKYWHRAISPHIAQHTEPVRLNKGVLTVRVDSASWAQELSFLKTELLEHLNRVLPEPLVADMKFVQGPLKRHQQQRPPNPKTPLPPPRPDEQEKVRAIVAHVADATLRETLYRTLTKHLVWMRLHRSPFK